jgi:Lon protease-like protein
VAEVLPLFPLGHVLLPGAGLPLRVFEPRYRALLADVTAPGSRNAFGVVALTAGIEVDSTLVDQQPRFADVGTVAEIMDVQPAPDGTSALLAVGSRRFRIAALIEGKPYVQAEVEYLDEPVGELPDALPEVARALSTEYLRLLARLTNAPAEPDPYPQDPVALSYRIAVEAPLVPADQQSVLAELTAAGRLHRLVRILRREVILVRRTRSVAVAPGVLNATLRPN